VSPLDMRGFVHHAGIYSPKQLTFAELLEIIGEEADDGE